MRYSISFAPPSSSSLWWAGSRWLGLDSGSGERLEQPELVGIDGGRLWELTSSARLLGLQAVVKPRFHLATDYDEGQLCAALERFAAKQCSMMIPPLEIRCYNGRFVLEPQACPRGVIELAAECTRHFDPFGLPLKISELARFRAAELSTQERKNLETWGNPYVFNQYRFRIRLSSRLSRKEDQELLYSSLSEYFSAVSAKSVIVDTLCLFVETDVGTPMRLLHRFPFSPQTKEIGGPVSYDPIQSENFYTGYQRRTA